MHCQTREFTLPLHCRYLLRPASEHAAGSMLVLVLHGYGMTPGEMLDLTGPLLGPEHSIVALQGPYQFWTHPGDRTRSRVAFHWNTSFEPEHSRRLHHDMILHVLQECGGPAVLLGYSQSVSLNYRFVATYPDAVQGVIAICGGLPGDWETAPYSHTSARALHIATQDDEYYPPSRTASYRDRLRAYIADVEFHMLEGGHRIPSSAAPVMRDWLARLTRT